MGLEISGLDKLQRRLGKLKVELSGPAEKRMVRAGAKVFKAEVEREAPVLDRKTAQSTSLKPGALKRGVRIRTPRNAEVPTAEVGFSKETKRVAGWVERGHRLVKGGYSKVTAKGSRGPGAEIGEVQAHPFVRPAFERARSAAEEAMVAEVQQMIRETERG